jgi:hypothetical protein
VQADPIEEGGGSRGPAAVSPAAFERFSAQAA